MLSTQAYNRGEAVRTFTSQSTRYLLQVTIPQRLVRYTPDYPTMD